MILMKESPKSELVVNNHGILNKEKNASFPAHPAQNEYVLSQRTKTSPSKKAGANNSIILGHFQKRLTPVF